MDELKTLADLLKAKNAIDRSIAAIIDRPALIGHIGEYIAAKILGLRLEERATNRGSDGKFVTGPYEGKSVNVKWYGENQRRLDMSVSNVPDYYLVLTGPHSSATSSKGRIRPAVIHFVYLFETDELTRKLRSVPKPVKIGVQTSIPKQGWSDAEIYPHDNLRFRLSETQKRLLGHFQ